MKKISLLLLVLVAFISMKAQSIDYLFRDVCNALTHIVITETNGYITENKSDNKAYCVDIQVPSNFNNEKIIQTINKIINTSKMDTYYPWTKNKERNDILCAALLNGIPIMFNYAYKTQTLTLIIAR